MTGKVGGYSIGAAEHRDARRRGVADADDRLHGGPPETRHPAPEQRRRDGHQSFAVDRRAGRINLAVRRRCRVLVLSERQLWRLLLDVATRGENDDNESYQGRFDFAADRYGAQLEFLEVGRNFNPEVGFVRRYGLTIVRLTRFSPRPRDTSSTFAVHLSGQENSSEWIGSASSRPATRRAVFHPEARTARFLVEGETKLRTAAEAFTVAPNVASRREDITSTTRPSPTDGASNARVRNVWFPDGEFYDGTITAYVYRPPASRS